VKPTVPPKSNPDAANDGAALIEEAIKLNKAAQYRAAKKKIDECRKVAPTQVRCVLLSGSIYANLSAEGDGDAKLLKEARGFYERFKKEACPGHPSCEKVEKILKDSSPK
jgi:hypothetical protein